MNFKITYMGGQKQKVQPFILELTFRTSDDVLTRRVQLDVNNQANTTNLDQWSDSLSSLNPFDILIYVDALQNQMEYYNEQLFGGDYDFNQLEEYFLMKEAYKQVEGEGPTCKQGYKCFEKDTCYDLGQTTCECKKTAGIYCEFDKTTYYDMVDKLNEVAKTLQGMSVNPPAPSGEAIPIPAKPKKPLNSPGYIRLKPHKA